MNLSTAVERWQDFAEILLLRLLNIIRVLEKSDGIGSRYLCLACIYSTGISICLMAGTTRLLDIAILVSRTMRSLSPKIGSW